MILLGTTYNLLGTAMDLLLLILPATDSYPPSDLEFPIHLPSDLELPH